MHGCCMPGDARALRGVLGGRLRGPVGMLMERRRCMHGRTGIVLRDDYHYLRILRRLRMDRLLLPRHPPTMRELQFMARVRFLRLYMGAGLLGHSCRLQQLRR